MPFRSLTSNSGAFVNQFPPQFSQGCEHAGDHAAGRGRGVDTFPQCLDIDAALAECVEGVDRVDEGTAESVEGVHDERVSFSDVVERSGEAGAIGASAGRYVVEDAVHTRSVESVVLKRNFRRLVAETKALWRTDNHRGRRPAVWAPGDYLVIDWATIGGLHLFCAVMAYSRWRFVAFAADEKATTTMASIAETLHNVGGVPAKVLADRMACLKGGVVANIVIPTPDYVRFAAHYGFTPDFCHAQDPQSKGVVENLVGHAQRDLAVPLFTEAKIAGATIDLPAANAAAKAWCVEVNARVHSEICVIPDEQLDTERELLAPLPSLRLEIGTPPVTRIVDRLSCVRFASAPILGADHVHRNFGHRAADQRALGDRGTVDRGDRRRTRVNGPGNCVGERRALRWGAARTAARSTAENDC
jgi:hypothetical protein